MLRKILNRVVRSPSTVVTQLSREDSVPPAAPRPPVPVIPPGSRTSLNNLNRRLPSEDRVNSGISQVPGGDTDNNDKYNDNIYNQ